MSGVLAPPYILEVIRHVSSLGLVAATDETQWAFYLTNNAR